MDMYCTIRFHQSGHNSLIDHGLTLEQAQAHCQRDDTRGETWFDGYDREANWESLIPDELAG